MHAPGARPEKPNIIQVIRDRYPELNETNKKIADFILQNLEMATFASLMEISRKIGVSDATLVRFARELDFGGYQDLRQALVEYIRKIIYPTQKSSILDEQGQHPFIDLVMKKDIEYITQTMSKVDPKGFDVLIEFLLAARRIYCMGWGLSSFLAEYLSFALQILSHDATPVIRERRPLVQQLLFIEKNDLLITFDLILYSSEVLEAVEYVHREKKSVKIVTITNKPLAQIVQYSDLSFFCDMIGHEFKLISLTAPLCFINAILEQVAAKNPAKTTKALVAFQRVVQSSPLHYSQFELQNFQRQFHPKECKGSGP
ncbi:MAG: MurR/RpiR family transcriptional regulator [Desulfobacterales bacterium]|nr:MAG: MurR/RpiR family transcriptional regulator [Desulfobacterales bacterium]